MLKVPTISDRAWQCLAKYALEPAHEATFHARSYGFRTGRSAHCAQKHLFDNLNSRVNGIQKRVIELDIKKCFDLYFIQKRAFKVFNKEKKQNRYTSKKLLNQAFPAVSYSENKFVNVKGDKSSYDGDIIYWSKRNSKWYDGETSKALQRQSHSCACCGLQFMTEDRVHLHHIDGNHDNWKQENLVAIHESCHDYLHMSKAQS